MLFLNIVVNKLSPASCATWNMSETCAPAALPNSSDQSDQCLRQSRKGSQTKWCPYWFLSQWHIFPCGKKRKKRDCQQQSRQSVRWGSLKVISRMPSWVTTLSSPLLKEAATPCLIPLQSQGHMNSESKEYIELRDWQHQPSHVYSEVMCLAFNVFLPRKCV